MELLLNKKSLGKQPAGKENRYTAAFELTYEPGILEAVSYENGVVISRCSLSTTGAPHAIRLTSDCPDTLASLSSDGHSLAYISVEIVDKNGVTVPDAALPLSAAVTGVGMLAGFGSANPITEENYTTGSFTSYRGRALAVIRSGYESGEVTLSVTANDAPDIADTYHPLIFQLIA